MTRKEIFTQATNIDEEKLDLKAKAYSSNKLWETRHDVNSFFNCDINDYKAGYRAGYYDGYCSKQLKKRIKL